MTSLEREIENADARKSRAIATQFETSRLLVRAAVAADAAETLAAALESAEALRPWMPWAYPAPTAEGVARYFASVEKKWADREQLDFQWIDRRDQRLIGKGGFHHIDWTIPKFEIGYWLRSGCDGQGFCTEAVNGLIAYARTELSARRLEICSDPRNSGSRAVAERCGFQLEGILRRNARAPDGALRDSCLYALVIE